MDASTPGMDVLDRLRSGRRDTLDRLMPVVYEQLRLIARHQLSMRPGGGTLKARPTQKREGALHRVTLDDEQIAGNDQAEVMLDINDAVDRLASVEPRLARVVECRFVGGLSEEETGEALDVTTRTVQRDWVKARMLLRPALSA
jgi:DNA-directed RNA polymerase specialized sigma24 family protein